MEPLNVMKDCEVGRRSKYGAYNSGKKEYSAPESSNATSCLVPTRMRARGLS